MYKDMTLNELQAKLIDLEDEIYDITDEIENRELPVQLTEIDTTALSALLVNYMTEVAKEGGMKSAKNWIYESVMETFYGPEIWEWINKTATW